MSKTRLLGINCYLLSLAALASDMPSDLPSNLVADSTLLPGIYEVKVAHLNETHCDKNGRLVDYASRFIRLKNTDNGLNIAICNGHSLSDLQCMGGYRSTTLKPAGNKWIGYQHTARLSDKSNLNPTCRLHALRRSILPMKGNFIRYERTDWSETLRDFIAECNEGMAAEYQVSQSLKCNSHISIIGLKVMDLSE